MIPHVTRIAIAGPDGAGKTTVCESLAVLLDNAQILYSGKSRGHLLPSTGRALELWKRSRSAGVPSILGRNLLFYPVEYAENIARLRFRPAGDIRWVIMDRHPIDRIVMWHDSRRKLMSAPLRLSVAIGAAAASVWSAIYTHKYRGVDQLFVLLPEPDLSFDRSGGQYSSVQQAGERVEAYRSAAAAYARHHACTVIELTEDTTVDAVCEYIIDVLHQNLGRVKS